MGNAADSSDPKNTPEKQLESIQSILFARERERIHALEERAEAFRQDALIQLENLQNESRALSAELQQAQTDLGGQVDSLRQTQNDLDGLVERLTPTISKMIGHSIRDSRDEMAEAFGPIMGESIRVQIRDSRQEMVDALYPIIGETVQKSLAEFARELQQNIDSRLKSTLSFRDTLGIFLGKARGIPSAQMTIRQALPFLIKEIFLVQRESGLLVAHSHPETAEASDADLVSNMLTAIRDFVRDSYGKGQETGELDEIQYGTQRIILITGAVVYLAVVITGIEPEGFRTQLREYLAELHIQHGRVLREYNGDPAQVPNFSPQLRAMSRLERATQSPRPLTRFQKRILGGGVFLSAACLVFSCFYLQFTLALLPLAFPAATPSATLTTTPTNLPSATTTPTSTPTTTLTTTLTSTIRPTSTFTPTFRPTASASPSITPLPSLVYPSGNVWVRATPQADVQPFTTVTDKIPLEILESQGIWTLISWQLPDGQIVKGWIPSLWLSVPSPSPTP